MKLKKIEATWVAAHCYQTSLSKIQEAVGLKPDQIRDELKSQGIEPDAPQIWNYIGCDGKMDTVFTLEICIPVQQKGKDTDFIIFKELNTYDALTHMHHGPWSEFAQVYEKLFDDICQQGHQPTGNCREVYHHCDFEDQSNCITELQIEIN